MKPRKALPIDGRQKKSKCDWDTIPLLGSVKANPGSAAYWSKKLAPKKFVTRDDMVWRIA
jgi:hypothetical protein